MATNLSFASLVEAITRSVAQAQDAVEKHQVRNLLSYFDANARPRDIEFRVPSRTVPGDEDFYRVPLLALVSINVLKIQDIKIRFAVDLGEMTEESGTAPDEDVGVRAVLKGIHKRTEQHDSQVAGLASPMKTLGVSTATGTSGGKVRVALRVKGSAPSEGAARLLDYLAQMQGIHPPITESTSQPQDANGG